MRVVWELLNVALSLVIGYLFGMFLILLLSGVLSDTGAGFVSLLSMAAVVIIRWRRYHSVPTSPVIERSAPTPGD